MYVLPLSVLKQQLLVLESDDACAVLGHGLTYIPPSITLISSIMVPALVCRTVPNLIQPYLIWDPHDFPIVYVS